jgi:hypothetical protein
MKRHLTSILGIAVAVSMTCGVFAQNPSPPSNLRAIDTPNDAGKAVDLTWSLSMSDIFSTLNAEGAKTDPELIVASYVVERITDTPKAGQETSDEDQVWRQVSEAAAGSTSWTDRTTERGWSYRYRIAAVDNQGDHSDWSTLHDAIMPTMQVFNGSKA